MPCYDEPTYQEEYDLWERKLRHDSPTAESFCELCQYLEQVGQAFDLSAPKAYRWWLEHKERDFQRLQQEKATVGEEKDKRDLLDRLTPYERKLLGVR